jgi:tetratricopeptide (TPR) repeat protein
MSLGLVSKQGLSSPLRAGSLLERGLVLGSLTNALDGVSSGSGHTVLICGEAGIGKTSVLRSFAAAHPGVRLWWGACDALETPHPLAPLYDIARSTDARFAAHLQGDGNRASLFESVASELQKGGRPTLMIVEDAHWADEATLDLLKFLGRRIDRMRCLLVVSYRDDELTAAHPLRRFIGELPAATVTRVDVPRLSPGAVELLARQALQSPAGIYEATRGNAFFVTELLRTGAGGLPRSAADLVLGRFARLSSGAQAIARLVSIVPRSIERWLVDLLLPADMPALEECLNSGLLMATSSSLHFRHELARIVVEANLSEPATRELHIRVLEGLVDRGESEISPARLAHHAARIGDRRAVLEHAPEAARRAAQRGAHRESIAHYRATLACAAGADAADQIAWLVAYARECQFTDQFDEAIAARVRASTLYANGPDTSSEGDNLSELALAYARVLKSDEAGEASRAAIALLETQEPSVALARAYRVAGHLHFLNRECTEAIAWSNKAILLAETLGARDVLAAALGSLGAALLFVDYEAGSEHLQNAFRLAVACGLEFMAAIVANNLGSGSGEVFRLREAREHLMNAIAFARQFDIDSARTYATSWLALCEMYLGRWNEAERHALDVIEGSADSTIVRVQALVALGRVRARRGDASAGVLLDEASALADAGASLHRAAFVRAARAEAAYLRGDLRAAVDEARPALLPAASRGDVWLAGELRYWMLKAGALDIPPAECAEPFALQIAGRFREAANAWASLGCPYEAARALAEGDVSASCRSSRCSTRIASVDESASPRTNGSRARGRGLVV